MIAGDWTMTYSTQYRGDRFGCVTLTMNKPDEKGLMQSTFRYNPVFWFNPVNVGMTQTDGFYLFYDISGTFFRRGLIDGDYGKVLMADDSF